MISFTRMSLTGRPKANLPHIIQATERIQWQRKDHCTISHNFAKRSISDFGARSRNYADFEYLNRRSKLHALNRHDVNQRANSLCIAASSKGKKTTTGMDGGAKKLLESVAIETLHAHHFSRASS